MKPTRRADPFDAGLNPPPQPDNALVPAPAAASALDALDAHGFDPADYQWVPVLRKPREDGWTPQRQVDFIAALADTALVIESARTVGMSVQSCYRLRRRSPAFAAAWDAAIHEASKRLADIAFDRAINGSDEPVFDKEGRRVGRRMRYNDRLLMFLLRAHQPERYRHAHQGVRQPCEPPPPALPPVEEALRALEPVTPDEPHKLMPPDELDTALECAHLLPGELPPWHRYRMPAASAPGGSPLGPEFEAALARAKREAAGLPPEPPEAEEEDDEDPFLA